VKTLRQNTHDGKTLVRIGRLRKNEKGGVTAWGGGVETVLDPPCLKEGQKVFYRRQPRKMALNNRLETKPQGPVIKTLGNQSGRE